MRKEFQTKRHITKVIVYATACAVIAVLNDFRQKRLKEILPYISKRMESIHSNQEFEEEYKEQFRNMTDEQIERHIGLEKVRNVMDGLDKDYGIDKIRKLIKEIKKEKVKK